MNLMEKVNAAIARKETALPKVELQAGKTYRAKLAKNVKLRKNSYTGSLELQFSLYVCGDIISEFNGGFLNYAIEVSDLDRVLTRKDGTEVTNRDGQPVTVGDIAASRFVSLGLTEATISALLAEVDAFASTVEAMGEDSWKGVKVAEGITFEANEIKVKTAAFGKNKTIGIKEIL